MSSGRQVVVTGLGAITPSGLSMAATWDAVVAGRSAIRPLRRFDLGPVQARYAGTVDGFGSILPADSLSERFAHTALNEALTAAGSPAVDLLSLAHHGERRAPSAERPTVVSTAQGLASSLSESVGASRTAAVFGACAAGALCIALAGETIRSGRAEVAACLGVDAMVNDFDFFQFANLYAMSTRDCGPEEASCPFDARRDGFVLSEGAACLILEADEHARRRGADPLAVLEGIGVSQSAYHMISSPPDAVGPAKAISAALTDGAVGTSAVGYVNAHGTSTRDNDWCETMALRSVFRAGADKLAVSSTKSTTGHLMGAAGTLEAAIAILAMRHELLPPTMNLVDQDPNCDLDYIPGEARTHRTNHVLTNSFGFGGHNTALVFGRT